MASLYRWSEPFRGGITAEGILNAMGRPPFDPLTLVIREAAQNSWDARVRKDLNGAAPPRLLIRLRTLAIDEASHFREIFSDTDHTDEPIADSELRKCLDRDPVRVLELCDFNTVGLAGGVDPRAPGSSSRENFVSFFYDVGKAHADGVDGGTYGFGRASLYLAGLGRTILVDSVSKSSESEGGYIHRFMGCRIGHFYQKRASFLGAGGRYSGRHYWGECDPDFGVRPLEAAEASSQARLLGLPIRDSATTGTTILIPWPDIGGQRVTGETIRDAVLLNLWPKLVDTAGERAMLIEIEEDGSAVPMPPVAKHPVFKPFVAALKMARTRAEEYGAQVIRPAKGAVVTGHLAIEATVSSTLAASTIQDDVDGRVADPFADGLHHVALMRPSELVVRYLEVPNAKPDGLPWAGVFLVEDEPAVRSAFAMAEPPAHDDWVADRIQEPGVRRLVKGSLRRISESVRGRFKPAKVEDGDSQSEHISLAGLSDAFSRVLLGGEGAAPIRGGLTSGSSRVGRSSRISRPEFVGLRPSEDGRCARFVVKVMGVSRAVRVSVEAYVLVDGGRLDDLPVGTRAPSIVAWHDEHGSLLGVERSLDVNSNVTLMVDIHFDENCAISASSTLEVLA